MANINQAASRIIQLIMITLSLLVIIFVAGIYFALTDPIYNNVIDPAQMTRLGWGTPQDTTMLFAGLAFAGLVLVLIIWWIVSPVKNDVRQNTGPPL